MILAGSITAAQREQLQQYLRLKPRQKIYCISSEDRQSLRIVTGHGQRLLSENPNPIMLIPVCTWDAQSSYVSARGCRPAAIVFDTQLANRLARLSMSQRHGFDAFDLFLCQIAVFAELCVAFEEYDLAERALEKFDDLRDSFFNQMMTARLFAPRAPSKRRDTSNVSLDEFAFRNIFAKTYLLGHEIGHEMYPEFYRSGKASEFFGVIHDITHTPVQNRISFELHGWHESEFVFRNGKAIKVRAYRGGHENMIAGLKHRSSSHFMRRDNHEQQEFFCDAAGLALAIHVLNENGYLSELPLFWASLNQAIVSQALLTYLAVGFRPIHDGAIPFIIPPLYERCIGPLRLLGQIPDLGGFLKRLGWAEAGRETMSSQLEQIADAQSDWIADNKDAQLQLLAFEVLRIFGDEGLAKSAVSDENLRGLALQHRMHSLFLPPGQMRAETSDLLFGSHMAYRFILELRRDQWISDERPKSRQDPDARREIRKRVIGLRLSWRLFVKQRLEKLDSRQ